MFTDFTRPISTSELMHVHKYMRSLFMKFMRKIKKSLRRLESPVAKCLSLVSNGANKNPFLIEQSSVQAVPNYSPVWSNNHKDKKSIVSVSITHPTEEVQLNKSLITKVENMLGIDISDFDLNIEQSVTMSTEGSYDELEWIDLPLTGTDYTLNFGVSAVKKEIEQSASPENNEFPKEPSNNDIVNEYLNAADHLSVDNMENPSMDKANEVLLEEVEAITEDSAEDKEDTKAAEPPVEEVTEPTVEDVTTDPEAGKVKSEGGGTALVEQSIVELKDIITTMAAAIKDLTAQVAETKKERQEVQVDQSVEVVERFARSSHGAVAVIEAQVEQSDSKKATNFETLSASERSSYVTRYIR